MKEEDGLKEGEECSNENGSSELSKSLETGDVGDGAIGGIPGDKSNVLDPPLLDSPSDDSIEPTDNEGVFTGVVIEFLPLTDGPLVSLPRRD